MTNAEILSRIDIPRSRLYYLEQKGYIKPVKIFQGNRQVKDYSKDDFVRVQTIWQFVKQGFNYQAAFEKVLDVINRFIIH